MAWRMLSGQAPFAGRHWIELLRNIEQEEPPSLLDRAPHLTVRLERVLRRALSKRRAGRYPTVRAFARAFESAATPASPAPVSPRSER
jgi:hypothetical protein